MIPQKEYLNPTRKLVDEVVDWLLCEGRVRRVEGAPSLAHMMVVVPTAQSGRGLRLALAQAAARQGWGGLLPPRVVQPMNLVKPADETRRAASSLEAAAAFQQYVKTHREEILALDTLVRAEEFEDLTARFALFDQLQDIWRALAGRGLLMADVGRVAAEHLAGEWGDEKHRWEQLAELEQGFFEYLHARGLVYPTEAVHLAKTAAAPLDPDIEEVVLPALADPVRVLGDVLAQELARGVRVTVLIHATPTDAERFDDWGWPRTVHWIGAQRPVLARLTDADIVCAPHASALAQLVADDFPSVAADAQRPSLALCDEDLFQPVASAFLNADYVVHNPGRHLLVQSSLGRLMRGLIGLYPAAEMRWRDFATVFRSADVLAWLNVAGLDRATVLTGMDNVQNAFMPTEVPRAFAFPSTEALPHGQQAAVEAFCAAGRRFEAAVAAARDGASLGGFLRRMLEQIFAALDLPEGPEGKEFQAAAECAREYLNALEGDVVASLNLTRAELDVLARRELDAVVYSLEPETTAALKTEGWLELPWSAADQIALTGLHEGKIPDSVIGHPFLPDALRAVLGLVTNEDRLARDTWIFQELLASHAEHAVRAYVARTTGEGDICRPSRLLYLCTNAALAARVKRLFGDLPEVRTDRARRIEWPLALPETAVFPAHFSPSALDTYIKCPLTYLLKYGLKMNAYREKRELEANDFGTYIHAALERYAAEQIARGDNQLTQAADIRASLLDRIVPALRARFGRKTTVNLALQLKAAEGRLSLFAERQAEMAQEGWRIRRAEYKLAVDVPALGFRVKGVVDRLDEQIETKGSACRWRLIDYKTWDEQIAGRDGTAAKRVVTSSRQTEKNRQQLDFARRMGFPLVGEEKQRLLSVQLPVYGMGLAAQDPDLRFDEMEFCYLVLGVNAKETALARLKDEHVTASLRTAQRAVDLIRANIFWPPGPSDEWAWDFGGLFVADPATDLAETPWVERQKARLEALHV